MCLSLIHIWIRFINAHATAATSTPSRYSMLTGEYAWRKPGTDVAAGNAGMIIRPEQYTMADMFKSSGYALSLIHIYCFIGWINIVSVKETSLYKIIPGFQNSEKDVYKRQFP